VKIDIQCIALKCGIKIIKLTFIIYLQDDLKASASDWTSGWQLHLLFRSKKPSSNWMFQDEWHGAPFFL